METGKAIIPYSVQAGRSAMEMGKTAWNTATPITKATITGAGGAASMETGMQGLNSIMCQCDAFNLPKVAVSGVIGGVGGAWGSSMAGAAGVEYITLLKLPSNLRNIDPSQNSGHAAPLKIT